MVDTVHRALNLAAAGIAEGDRPDIVAAIETLLNAASCETSGFRMLDPSLDSEGGFAFLWEDFLPLSDILDGLGAMTGQYAPDELAKIAILLVQAWRRLRRVRVQLTKEEMAVMLAVKRGAKSSDHIAERCGLPLAEATAAIKSLTPRRYKEDVPLLDGIQGNYSTVF